jgi:uncharacterized membrane protein YgaE (UPF0421/DUF939 family)
MRIGFRTVKTAVGTALSVAVAQWLGLMFYASAGIITILCIKTTRKRSFQTARERILACLAGTGLSFAVFGVMGYEPWSITLILLFLIPVCLYLKAKEGIVTAMVIIFHFYTLKKITPSALLNEWGLILIGIGFAVLVNLYMPNMEKELETYRERVEQNFRVILREFADYLRGGDRYWDGREITETATLLKEAKELALRDLENQPHPDELNHYRYFDMRERQFDILVRIMPLVSTLETCCVQGEMIADFLERLADGVHSGNTASLYLDELERIRKQFKHSPLPATREEFEARAALLHFVNEMKRYLIIKRDLWRKKQTMEGGIDHPVWKHWLGLWRFRLRRGKKV